jgi:hypothetical protein
VSSHISGLLFSYMSGSSWQSGFQNIVTLASLVYGYSCVCPAVMWLFLRQLDAPVSLVPIACLYGYSLSPYIPAAVSLRHRA